MKKRRSGILLHPSSLPGPFGIGDIGFEAYNFLEFLKETKTAIWQILPLGPTGAGNSPYTSFSAFAGNELLISPEKLMEEGFLTREELKDFQFSGNNRQIDFTNVAAKKKQCLQRAYARFTEGAVKKINPIKSSTQPVSARDNFEFFTSIPEISFWLDHYALFRALKETFNGKAWNEWPKEIQTGKNETIGAYLSENREMVDFFRFCQFLFFRQWYELKKKANEMGIIIFGDIPIFVAYDSADVWKHQEIFELSKNGKPRVVAGVPPDYFSSTGQLWGNPIYNWKKCKQEGYRWWIERLRTLNSLVDWIRIDHFRGFEAYWEIPFAAKTAVGGKWKKGPGIHFFQSLKKEMGDSKIIAEDLGVITPEVEKLRDRLNFPGMKILHFAFGGDSGNLYLPHNHIENCIVYTGTHDNDTTTGWYHSSSEAIQKHVRDYLGMDDSKISLKLIRTAFCSVADTAIIPMQDLLELDSGARMNIPSVANGNWQWRMESNDISEDRREYLKSLNALTGRGL